MGMGLTKRQRETMERAQKVPINKRTYTELNEARGIVGSTPREQCEAARRHNNRLCGGKYKKK